MIILKKRDIVEVIKKTNIELILKARIRIQTCIDSINYYDGLDRVFEIQKCQPNKSSDFGHILIYLINLLLNLNILATNIYIYIYTHTGKSHLDSKENIFIRC